MSSPLAAEIAEVRAALDEYELRSDDAPSSFAGSGRLRDYQAKDGAVRVLRSLATLIEGSGI